MPYPKPTRQVADRPTYLTLCGMYFLMIGIDGKRSPPPMNLCKCVAGITNAFHFQMSSIVFTQSPLKSTLKSVVIPVIFLLHPFPDASRMSREECVAPAPFCFVGTRVNSSHRATRSCQLVIDKLISMID